MTQATDPRAPGSGTNTGRIKEDRLSKQDWLDAGLKLLGKTGPGGLRIDHVCKAMKVTKGSFYWHFRDRRDFLGSLFDHWRRRETTGLIRHVETTYVRAEQRIWHVVEFVTLGTYDVGTEVAMRQWGQSDPDVRAGLKQVDAERLGFFTRQFESCGFDTEPARLRAISVYSFTLSCGYMLTGETRDALRLRLRQSLDLLLARD
ncbi:MAG: TetR/AcrR family transcriptional regulator [Pseudodonghicola sp.]